MYSLVGGQPAIQVKTAAGPNSALVLDTQTEPAKGLAAGWTISMLALFYIH